MWVGRGERCVPDEVSCANVDVSDYSGLILMMKMLEDAVIGDKEL